MGVLSAISICWLSPWAGNRHTVSASASGERVRPSTLHSCGVERAYLRLGHDRHRLDQRRSSQPLIGYDDKVNRARAFLVRRRVAYSQSVAQTNCSKALDSHRVMLDEATDQTLHLDPGHQTHDLCLEAETLSQNAEEDLGLMRKVLICAHVVVNDRPCLTQAVAQRRPAQHAVGRGEDNDQGALAYRHGPGADHTIADCG